MILILFLPFFVLYFAPSIVALARGRQIAAVLLINFFLGWTFVGWIVALALAISAKPYAPVVVQQFGYHPQYPPPGYQPQFPPPPGYMQQPPPSYPPQAYPYGEAGHGQTHPFNQPPPDMRQQGA